MHVRQTSDGSGPAGEARPPGNNRPRHALPAVADPATPVLLCDARERASCKEVLIGPVEHAASAYEARMPANSASSSAG
ncbi:hypothetical protein [Streptomyces platensis]|uniref:hypothetical protein n=1 Tax=Streptomyces platensis TaxID=58346 RepID=UPI003864156D